MNIFDKRIKIDARLMGKVIFELADERCRNLFQLLSADSDNDYDEDFYAYNLVFYSFAINFYFMGNILNHKNSSTKTALAMSSALDFLCRDLAETASEKVSKQFRAGFPGALAELGNLCATNSSADLDNSFSRLSKFFLGKIYPDNRYVYDAFRILEFSEMISNWISDSMFLIEKYKIVK